MIYFTSRVPLATIIGLSPRNVRGETRPEDVADLAASIGAVGLIQPLVVERAADAPGLLVVDGGRRLTALRRLEAAGAFDASAPIVPVVQLDECDDDPRAISLAANVLRRDLHPVEEFEAFARLVADGQSVERIAADFGRSIRFVRQRLALDRLSPRVRALWRAGTIQADIAIPFTKAPDHAAQDAVLDEIGGRLNQLSPYSLGQRFGREGGERSTSAQALYVGLDAYQAAGGTIDDNLFQDWSICEDGALLKRLARDKMMAEGAAILEQTGFGTCLIDSDVEQSWNWGRLPVDVTDADKAEFAAIDRRAKDLDEREDLDEEAAEALSDALSAERAGLHLRAILRGSTADQRAQAAIFLSLNHDGTLRVDYGRVSPKMAAAAAKRAFAPAGGGAPRDGATTAPTEPARPPTKAVIECLDDARVGAFATLIAARPMLAMLLCTAALRTGANRSPLRIAATGRNGRIAEPTLASFSRAVTELLGLRDREALLEAFARAVAQTLAMVTPSYERNGGRADPTDLDGLVQVLAHYAGDAFEPALRDGLNYRAYFAAATRAAALAAIEETGGDVNAARKLKADQVAAAAAERAADKAWLPKELRAPAPIVRKAVAIHHVADLAREATSLADAMFGAIEADTPGVTPAESAVSEWLSWACVEDTGATVELWRLYDVFRVGASDEALALVPDLDRFDDVLQSLGFESSPSRLSVLNLSFGLAALAPRAQAAE